MNENSDLIIGRNNVREAIRAGGRIDRVYVVQGVTDGSIRELVTLARGAKLVIKEVTRSRMDEMCAGMGHDGKPGNHQGVAAQVPAFPYGEMDDIFALAQERGDAPFIIVLDGIQDPHNLGAVIRSAEALGAHGVVIGKHRAASLTAAAAKVSCGAVQYIPVVKVTNINRTLEELNKKNRWVIAADPSGGPLSAANLTGAAALVIGGEGAGVSRLTRELCDMTVRIELSGHTESLNASCAAAVMMYEKRRQDLTK
jgi:23S rRNA (guanosine2251-2'-O)-methyltransferase